MTKKSQARLKRDADAKAQAAYKKSNTGWDDMKRMYTNNQSSLNLMSTHVSKFFAIENIELFIAPQHVTYTVSLMRSFSNDLKAFQKRLTDLFDQHKDRTGMVDAEDPSQYTFLVSVIDAYGEFDRDMRSILSPVYVQLSGMMETIEGNIQKAAAAAAEKAQA